MNQVLQFLTQMGVVKKYSIKKRTRELFIMEDDTLLNQSRLNVSKDPIEGVDQKANNFLLRITTNYNQYRGQSREKKHNQLKC